MWFLFLILLFPHWFEVIELFSDAAVGARNDRKLHCGLKVFLVLLEACRDFYLLFKSCAERYPCPNLVFALMTNFYQILRFKIILGLFVCINQILERSIQKERLSLSIYLWFCIIGINNLEFYHASKYCPLAYTTVLRIELNICVFSKTGDFFFPQP